MCIHPRCGKKGIYRLEKTEMGSDVDLCEIHGPRYHKSKGGEISLLFPFKYQKHWQQRLSELTEGEGNGS